MALNIRRTLRRAPLLVALSLAMAFVAVPAAAAAPLSIKIEGNHFVNGEGQTIRLLGVNHTSSEYGCVDGFGYDDGHFDDADAAAIAAWNANAVRVPLNEDCWLGINGQPNSSQGAEPPLTKAGYQQEIKNYVAALNAHGLYAILDLHWTAPLKQVALEQQPMPDAQSVPFWESVAATFKNNPAVVFDAFNEPYDPTDPRSGDDVNAAHKVSWDCWENGGCTTQAYDEEGKPTTTYTVVGMQALVNSIRGTGATQPVMVGGLDYANDLSGWLEHAPTDPLNQVAASFHNYMEKTCDNVDCWNGQIAPVAARVPVVTGEFAEYDFQNPSCSKGPNNFDNEYMSWADAHGVGYLAWAWIVLEPQEIESEGCRAYYLIGDYSGTPASVNGVAVHDHLLGLGTKTVTPPVAGGGGTGTGSPTPQKFKLSQFGVTTLSGGKVRLRLESAQPCRAAIAGKTVKPFPVEGRKPRKLVIGTAGVNLKANEPRTVTIKLPVGVRRLLKANGSLKAHFTVALSAGQASTFTQHTVTLKQPKPKRH